MKTMMLLGLGALVAVVFLVLFMSGEFKNRTTFTTRGHVNKHQLEVARESLAENDLGKNLFQQLYGNLNLGPSERFIDPLYAQGGGYDTFSVPYGKTEMPQLMAAGAKITDSNWVKDYETDAAKEEVDRETLTRQAAGQRFYGAYSQRTDRLTQPPRNMRHLDQQWAREDEQRRSVLGGGNHTFVHPHDGVVSSHHTRHQARADHGNPA